MRTFRFRPTLAIIACLAGSAAHAQSRGSFCDLQNLQSQMRSGSPVVVEAARAEITRKYGPNVAALIGWGGNVVPPGADCRALQARADNMTPAERARIRREYAQRRARRAN